MRQPLVAILALLLAAGASAPAAAQGVAQSAQGAAPAPRAPLPADSLQLARSYSVWFYTARFDSIAAHYAADPGEKLAEVMRNFEEQLNQLAIRAGSEDSLISERWVMRRGNRQYWRTAKFSRFDEPIVIRWAVNPKGQIVGLGINPESQNPPVDP